MHYLDKKYIGFISSRLERFVWKSNEHATFRCPLCGDSKKSKKKTRGNFYVRENVTRFGCFNCGQDKQFKSFLYEFDRQTYNEFRMESLIQEHNGHVPQVSVTEIPVIANNATAAISSPLIFSDLLKLTELDRDHYAVKYVISRKIEFFMHELYYVPNFVEWGAARFETLEKWSKVKEHSRLIIPCYNAKNTCIGFTARSFQEVTSVRYCHVKLSETEFLFGLERLDTNKRVKIVEGNIDSLMIDNAIAVMGSNLNSCNIFSDFVVIFDNQPRNKEICRLIEKTIKEDKNVVIWPDWFTDKDLNDAVVKSGYNKESLENIISENTFHGIMATMKFNSWKKY